MPYKNRPRASRRAQNNGGRRPQRASSLNTKRNNTSSTRTSTSRGSSTMPLPWSLPTIEEADELYRRIDQLITDLYHLIRSIIFGPPPLPPQQEPPDVEDNDAVPDLLAELGGPPAPSDGDTKPEDQPPMR